MSQQFLSQILKVENEVLEPLVASLLQVQSDSREPCCICLQDIGRLSPETGVIECEIRLPCSHRVGSACVATWLRTNNTCPVCRQVFFHAQARQHPEWNPLQDEDVDFVFEDHPATADWPRLSDNIEFLCDVFCEDLDLSVRLSYVALRMAEHLELNMGFENHTMVVTARLIVSTTLYMVTHIMNEHRSLDDISGVSGIQVEQIRRAYRHIHPIREQLIRPETLWALRGGSVQDFLELLPAPSTENGFMDHGGGGNDLEHYLLSAPTKQLEELCNQYSDELAHSGDARDICRRIAGQIRAGLYLTGLSPLPVVAVSLYMASHLTGLGTSIMRISEVVGISEGTIRNAYRSVYPWRDEFIDSNMLDMYENIRRHRVLGLIAWPAL